jgi:hypothetical protein
MSVYFSMPQFTFITTRSGLVTWSQLHQNWIHLSLPFHYNFHYIPMVRVPWPDSWALILLLRNCNVSVILEFLYFFPKEELLFLNLVIACLYVCWFQQPTLQVLENHPRRTLMQGLWLSTKSWSCWTVCMELHSL